MDSNIIAVGSFILSVISIFYAWHNNKRTSFINSVTAERVKWINTLRENLSKFTGLYVALTLKTPTSPQWHDLLKETDCLRMLIKLQLNPAGGTDRQIEELLDQLNMPGAMPTFQLAQETAHKIIKLGQELLKQEWEKVKKESKYGDLNDPWYKFWQDQCDCSE